MQLPSEDFTTFVGRNDGRKSTVVNAFDTNFNDKPLDKNYAAKGVAAPQGATCVDFK
jgi:hypothetical protein